MNTILTPCILQTIIICCTIIIITIIAVSAYRIKKGQQRSWGAYIYYASILSIFTISIFSYCFYGNRNVLDFVSLASALISIILAIITIIYSFYIRLSIWAIYRCSNCLFEKTQENIRIRFRESYICITWRYPERKYQYASFEYHLPFTTLYVDSGLFSIEWRGKQICCKYKHSYWLSNL